VTAALPVTAGTVQVITAQADLGNRGRLTPPLDKPPQLRP